MTAAWKKLRFILSIRSDFYMTDSLKIAAYVFASHVLKFEMTINVSDC